MRTCCVAIGCVLCAANAAAQALPKTDEIKSPAAVFKSGVDLVALNVVVTDASQKFISGLEAGDFAVYEDGILQDISFFASSSVPLDLALLVDTSASMTDKMATMQQAAVGFASTIGTEDRISIVDIKDTVRVLYLLGSDLAEAIGAIQATLPGGGTALYNGLYVTLKNIFGQRRMSGDVRRQAIVVFSDGEDTTSLVGFDEVLELAKQAGITIYTVTLQSNTRHQVSSSRGSRYFSQSDFGMKTLAHETGGRAFFPAQITDLAGIYGMIAEELANQYAIGYTSSNPRRDGLYRRVIVRVDRPEARTRARAGYLAARTQTASR